MPDILNFMNSRLGRGPATAGGFKARWPKFKSWAWKAVDLTKIPLG